MNEIINVMYIEILFVIVTVAIILYKYFQDRKSDKPIDLKPTISLSEINRVSERVEELKIGQEKVRIKFYINPELTLENELRELLGEPDRVDMFEKKWCPIYEVNNKDIEEFGHSFSTGYDKGFYVQYDSTISPIDALDIDNMTKIAEEVEFAEQIMDFGIFGRGSIDLSYIVDFVVDLE